MEGINERLQKKALTNGRGRYLICQLRNGTFRSMNLTELIKKEEHYQQSVTNRGQNQKINSKDKN
jgi:hypothetical protein